MIFGCVTYGLLRQTSVSGQWTFRRCDMHRRCHVSGHCAQFRRIDDRIVIGGRLMALVGKVVFSTFPPGSRAAIGREEEPSRGDALGGGGAEYSCSAAAAAPRETVVSGIVNSKRGWLLHLSGSATHDTGREDFPIPSRFPEPDLINSSFTGT